MKIFKIRQKKKVSVAILLLSLALSLTACVGGGGGSGKNESSGAAAKDSTGGGGGGGGSITGGGGTETPTNPIAAQVVNVGIKNFEQINSTFSVLTGVPETTGAVATEYNAIRASLPLNNDLRTYGGSTQNAILKLAARYCAEAMGSDTLRANVLPNNLLLGATTTALPIANVDNTVPAQALTAANNAKIVDFMIDKFWARPSATPANADDARLVTLMNELALGEAAQGTTTRNVLVGVCTAALANVNVFTM